MHSGDLVSCESEPIHLLGGIQPVGFLLAVDASWVVVRASENVGLFLGTEHARILGQPVERCIPKNLLHDIRGRLQMSTGLNIPEYLFGLQLRPDGPAFSVAVHQSGTELIMEFEHAADEPVPPDILRGMIARIDRHRTMPQLYRETARQVRALTGFDRCMVYLFDAEGAGEVVGEAARAGLPPFLGLRYPASDIPSQARALYEINLLRGIFDVDARPVAVLPAISPEGERLDLSMSVLRSVSPVHLEYLRNMGVRASLSVSILRDGKLTGLIACHHETPKHVGLAVRSVAELFARMLSALLWVRQRERDSAFERSAHEIHHRISSAFAVPAKSLSDIPNYLSDLPDYISADGVGTYDAGTVTLAGVTPSREEFLQLVRFLNSTASGRVFSTHCLSEIYPPAADYPMRAAGLLSIPISRVPRDYLVFFRRETVSAVTWAGQPTKPEEVGPNGVRLTPRKSFEAWREIVRNRSHRWTDAELRAANSLRTTLIDVVLRMSDAAEAERVGFQHRQELLIAELNHRVRNILGLVRGLVAQSGATATDIMGFVASLEERIASLARAHDLLTSFNWAPASLHALMRAEIGTFIQSESRVILVGPDVLLQPKAFTAVALVVHELVTNARKYGALSTAHGQIMVTIASGRRRQCLDLVARVGRAGGCAASAARLRHHDPRTGDSIRGEWQQPPKLPAHGLCH